MGLSHSPCYDHASYLSRILPTNMRRRSIQAAVTALSKYDFDAFAFRGMSGALIAPSLAVEMDKTLILVRKTTDGCHSFRMVEGDSAARRYIIVDDCVDSGNTAQTIVRLVKGEFAPKAVCLGVLEIDRMLLERPDQATLTTWWMEAEDIQSIVLSNSRLQTSSGELQCLPYNSTSPSS
jgi:orotate phosphoribosyltransferase